MFLQKFFGTAAVGKHIINPANLNVDEIKCILWTAIELKHLHQTNKLPINLLAGKNAVSLLRKDCIQSSTDMAAANLLNVNLCKIVNAHWDESKNLPDIFRYLQATSDIVLCRSDRYVQLNNISNRLSIPIISLRSSRHAFGQTLADVMTIYEQFGRLMGLNLVWIGVPSSFINCYMKLAPRLGINMRYTCTFSPDSTEGPITPFVLSEALKLCNKNKIPVEYINYKEALIDADILILRTAVDCKFQLHETVMDKAKPHWMIIQRFPRKINECVQQSDKRNLIWHTVTNYKYVIAAMMLHCLTNYVHTTKEPNF